MTDANKKRITLAKAATAELEEKKSLFIGYAAPVCDEVEAKRIIDKRKKEHGDATHNVWAYLLGCGAQARYSDDGEPQGTAGIPLLNVLKMSGATDLVVVVTRYFGGTLLGAGGLVRAYSSAAKLAVDAAGLAVMESFAVFEIHVAYSDYQKLTVQFAKTSITEDSAVFTENVCVVAAVEANRTEEIKLLVQDLTAGRGSLKLLRHEERSTRF